MSVRQAPPEQSKRQTPQCHFHLRRPLTGKNLKNINQGKVDSGADRLGCSLEASPTSSRQICKGGRPGGQKVLRLRTRLLHGIMPFIFFQRSDVSGTCLRVWDDNIPALVAIILGEMRSDGIKPGFSPPANVTLRSSLSVWCSNPWSDRDARLPRFVLSLGVLSFFNPLRIKLFARGPHQAMIKRLNNFTRTFQASRSSFKVALPSFPGAPVNFFYMFFLQWPPTCFWFLSFPSLLPFFFLLLPLSSHDKLHSSHSSISKSKVQLTPWARTGLAVRLDFFPSFHFFSAQSRPPALFHRLQQVVHVGLQMFALLVADLRGLPHFFHHFFRSFLLNFFCSKNF